MKREINYSLAKNVPKRKAQIDQSGQSKQFPFYEGEEEPSSEDEPFLNEQEVVIRRKKKQIPWRGLEHGIVRGYNRPEESDKVLWDRFSVPRQLILGAESSLGRLMLTPKHSTK